MNTVVGTLADVPGLTRAPDRQIHDKRMLLHMLIDSAGCNMCEDEDEDELVGGRADSLTGYDAGRPDARCINATATLVASAEHYARMEAKRASEEARLREAVMLAAERRLTVLALEVARAESESARLALAAFVSALCACMAVAALVLQRVIGGGKALA
jgi:hypothetical protein